MPEKKEPALPADVVRQIRVVRGQKVLLDSDLAALYGVTTKAFNQAVRRNIKRFPADFVVQLTPLEARVLRSERVLQGAPPNQGVSPSRSQIVTLNRSRGHNLKYAPMAFTEHGAIMAATVLNSPQAVQMSVYVVRAFVKLRQVLVSHSELSRRLESLERSVAALDADTRKQFDQVYEAILGLMGKGTRRQ
jgi:hypothetical protein